MALAIDTLFVGRTHAHVPQLSSTNSYAQDLISHEQLPEGTLITAGFQEYGRGQIGKTWYSSRDLNILSSTVLYPVFLSAVDQFQLSIAVSVALHKTVSKYLPERGVTIKWPNDLYVDNRKIAGILIQNTLKGPYISSSIVGIGLNVNELDWPSDIPNPTSLAKELGREIDVFSCLGRLLSHIETEYLALKSGEKEKQKSYYLDHLYLRHQERVFRDENGNTLAGQIIGIDNAGRLLIDLGQETRAYQFREIAYVHNV